MTNTNPAQLITVCAWCHHVMVANVATPEPDPMTSDVSHGICRECTAKLWQEGEADYEGVADALDYSYRFEPDTLEEMHERCG
jgi:hypothetical protein